MNSTDVVIIGGGSVGLTAALALSKSGYACTVIERGTAEHQLAEPEPRVSALSIASQEILSQLGAWDLMDSSRQSPYSSMHVWDKESFGDINFSADQINEHLLGHIVENQNIRNGLIKAAKADSNIDLKFESQIQQIHNNEDQVVLTLANGNLLLAKLAIAADGANSWVKKQLKSATTFSDYDHHAIVANIQTTEGHQACARQVFLPNGPLALLPMFGEKQNICSIVWSTKPDHAKQLTAMDDVEFNKQLTAATDSVLGPCKLISERASFPLTMRYTQRWIVNRVIFIGDAAHTIHPLAGLGMNLGLLDAASLVDCLETKSAQSLADSAALNKKLRKFERWRKAEAQVTIAAMSGLKNLFDGAHPIKKLIRGVGLKLTDKNPLAKRAIVKHAMGLTGDLPILAIRKDEI